MMNFIKKLRSSMSFVIISGIILAFTAFCLFTNEMFFRLVTAEMKVEGAFDLYNIVYIISTSIDSDLLDNIGCAEVSTYVQDEREHFETYLSTVCEDLDFHFIYITTTDYPKLEKEKFIFVAYDKLYEGKRIEQGSSRKITSDVIKDAYRTIYEGKQEYIAKIIPPEKSGIDERAAFVILPLKNKNGEICGTIMMENKIERMVALRKSFVALSILLSSIFACLFCIVYVSYAHKHIILPIKLITKETKRFAEENTKRQESLSNVIKKTNEIGVLANSIDVMEQKTLDYMDELTAVAAERERVGVEMGIARRIQLENLPDVIAVSAGCPEIEASGLMVPAKEVGGDFYDFFFVDDEHLAIVIADVSGKGVPGALFMMASKSLINNRTRNGILDPAEVLAYVNNELCRNNSEELFVTVWMGIMELSTGNICAVNAGHEYPVIKRKDGAFEVLDDGEHDLALGVMEDMQYSSYQIKLEKGDRIFLYSDGIPEANDKDNKFLGMDQMVKMLNGASKESSQGTIDSMWASLQQFMLDAEQFDDISMLCLTYHGIDE